METYGDNNSDKRHYSCDDYCHGLAVGLIWKRPYKSGLFPDLCFYLEKVRFEVITLPPDDACRLSLSVRPVSETDAPLDALARISSD